jgi:hypothetical protein
MDTIPGKLAEKASNKDPLKKPPFRWFFHLVCDYSARWRLLCTSGRPTGHRKTLVHSVFALNAYPDLVALKDASCIREYNPVMQDVILQCNI